LVDATSADGSDFKIDGEAVTQICFIGQIRNVVVQSLKFTYKLDDGTGTIDVHKWLEDDDRTAVENGSLVPIQQDTYVKAFGRLKELNGRRHAVSTFIREIQDHNEVSCHLLDSTLVHLQMTRGPPGKGGNAKSGAAHGENMDVDMGGGDEFGGGNGVKKDLSKLSPGARKVFTYIAGEKQGYDGVHVSRVAAATGIEYSKVMEFSEELLNQGMIFSTADEMTWAVLDI
jgi:replication factor A2